MTSRSAWTEKGLGGTTTLRAIPSEFVERVWRTIKYEEVYLKAYANMPDARASIEKYLDFYNGNPGAVQTTSEPWSANAGSGLLQGAAANPGCGITKSRNHL